MPESELERTLAAQLEYVGLSAGSHRQFRWHPTRRYRADFAWPGATPPLLVEVQGGTWAGGRHTRGSGYRDDCRRLNAATLLGFRSLYFTGEMVESGEALKVIEGALATCIEDVLAEWPEE